MTDKKRGRPAGHRTVWSAKMESQLKKLFPKTENGQVAALLHISVRSVRSKAQIMGLKKENRYWSEADCKWLMAHYGATGYGFQEVQNHFPSKTKWAIINKYRSLTGLRIDNARKK